MLSKIPESESLAMLETNNGEIEGAILSYPVSNEAEKIENVTYQDIVDVCQNIELDTIFLLKGRNE